MFAKRASSIFDIGANIGFYALLAGAIKEKGSIFAFEPVSRIFELLKDNININMFSNVIPIQKVVTDYEGVITFMLTLKVIIQHLH